MVSIMLVLVLFSKQLLQCEISKEKATPNVHIKRLIVLHHPCRDPAASIPARTEQIANKTAIYVLKTIFSNSLEVSKRPSNQIATLNSYQIIQNIVAFIKDAAAEKQSECRKKKTSCIVRSVFRWPAPRPERMPAILSLFRPSHGCT